MSTAISITRRRPGEPRYPMYTWKVNRVGETPYAADTLKEAKEWAARYCGVTEWVRSVEAGRVTYTPVVPPTGGE